MTTILHIDASARPGQSGTDPHGSHTRRLSSYFIRRWRERFPEDKVVYRDVGAQPPAVVTGDWVHAAFTKPEDRVPWMHGVLAESDTLVGELFAADTIVAGVPMYNFGVPAPFKAYIDNVVRVGRTFGFERRGDNVSYWPMLPEGKRLVLLSSRGDVGYDKGGPLEHSNHVEPQVKTAFAYIGLTDVWSAAAEYDEYGGDRLAVSLTAAERDIDGYVREA
ncbi:FMN-dependent NADH-azoreductase [Kordiimonas aestuarii]|uniref:FMN-dependent NADH-azoreductase n=1 Tax=Kordiimonas aestuarii TaxID=1005925 RepID=UPI0021D00C7E|nr:NAD(P)H-dependent oxidoreductase [Kordiimonas aestuarii]